MDELVLIFSAVAAVASSISVYLVWWGTELSSAHIEMRKRADSVTFEFSNTGNKPLLLPRVEINGQGIHPVVTDDERGILRAEDDPIRLTIPTNYAQKADELAAVIQWTESGRRKPKLRGLRWTAESEKLYVLKRGRKWVALSKRRIRKIRGRYSQI